MAANDTIVPIATTVSPFYDDYSEDKGFYRILYRPGHAVQGRELTQDQTIGQKQIQRFGDSVYKNGSLVTGGQISYYGATFINLATQYANTDVSASAFNGSQITDIFGANTVRAVVLSTTTAANGATPVLAIKYLTGNEFGSNDTIQIPGQNVYANLASSNSNNAGTLASIQAGVFYINGFFVKTPTQTVILDPFSTTPSLRIGLQFEETIITEAQDTSLLDPALQTSNAQAPGAARYKIDLVLATRTLDSTDDSSFIELLRVANGVITQEVLYPTYSELGDTMARRTFDQSGSWTVRPFKLRVQDDVGGNTAQISATLDPGKAYVLGYEFQTIAPTNVPVRRAQDTTTVNNFDLAMDYGNYTIIGPLSGLFDITNTSFIDLHCVPDAQINLTNSGTYNTTKIGTARIRSLVYSDSSNTQQGNTYNYRAYIDDTRFISINGNTQSATVNTITLQANLVSNQVNAYFGATVTIASGTGAGQSKYIVGYNGGTAVANLANNWSTTPDATSAYQLQFNFKQTESMVIAVVGTPTTLSQRANIATEAKDTLTAAGNTQIFETAFDTLLFTFPQSPIVAASISSQQYSYRKLFGARTFNAGVGTITAATGEAFNGNGILPDTQVLTDYIVVVKNNSGSANISNGQVLSYVSALGRSVNVSSGNTVTFTTNLPGDTYTADILATVNINTGQEENPKLKTLVAGLTTATPSTSPNATFGNVSTGFANVHLNYGQVHFTNPNKIPGGNDWLYISDVTALLNVFDFGTNSIGSGASLPGSATEITNNYILDTGQRDGYYDHGHLTLKSGVAAPQGPIVVVFNYYSHGSGTSDGLGYFSVDSYPNASTSNGYAAIPAYTSPTSGDVYQLRDCIDFRPRRQDAVNTSPSFTLQGVRFPIPDTNFGLNYSYYLARVDKLVLTKDLNFLVLEGISGQAPLPPNDLKGAMTLYQLNLPAYTFSPANVAVTFIENKRYTMRDIGTLEQRISNLEYYTALSLLEAATYNQSITDSNGLERTKYGFIVDDFNGHSIGDVQNLDYKCAIDFEATTLQCSFNTVSDLMYYDTANSASVTQTGDLLTLPYNQVPFISQNLASHIENANPYTFANFVAVLNLNPTTDVWVETNVAPTVVTNTTGQNDAWVAVGQSGGTSNNDSRNPFGTRWNYWQAGWNGIDKNQQKLAQQQASSGSTGFNNNSINRTTPSVTDKPSSGSAITATQAPQTITQTVGNLTVDVSVIPYIRSRDVFFVARHLRPTIPVYFFFDGVAVQNYCQRTNKITFAATALFDDAHEEKISSGSNSATVLVVQDNASYVANVKGNIVVGQTWTDGSISGVVASISHWSGTAQSGTSNTISLATWANANTSNLDYVGNTIYVVAGAGIGTQASITAYNSVTKVATISGSWTTTPNSTTRYSIGQAKSGDSGAVSGTFVIPSTTAARFHTGSRIFTVIDNSTDDPSTASCVASATYYAEGLLDTEEPQKVSTQPPVVNNPTPQANTIIPRTNGSASPNGPGHGGGNSGGAGGNGGSGGRNDPLAETFFVDSTIYPEGVFLSSIDLFFATKDSSLPVYVYICPTLNGYPDTDTILPFSMVTLYPASVKVADGKTVLPNTLNSATATRFTFESPVYLQPGQYAIVCGTNSADYNCWVGELGENIIGTDREISSQPYIGSLFKSQNSSTWTPFQLEDLMFVLNRCDFNTGVVGIPTFLNAAPAANVPMDLAFASAQVLNFNSTEIDWAFKSTVGSTLEGSWTSFNINQNYPFSDASGRRTILGSVDGSYRLQASMSSVSSFVSPVIDTTRTNLLAIENIINNGGFSNSDITITFPGLNVTNISNLSVAITGGNGSGANAYVAAIANSNVVTIAINVAGDSYVGQANGTVTGGGATSNATFVLASEAAQRGGNSKARYITRAVTLASGFNAGDIRVYLDAYKPVGTDIEVYYKILSKDDPDTLDNKPWTRMTQSTLATSFSSAPNDFIEYQYNASNNGNSISYQYGGAIFTSFNTYQIKIVMNAASTTLIPLVMDMRAIALPASS